MRIIFTSHAEKRLRKRGILRQEIVYSIKSPNRIIKKHGLFYYQKRLERGMIEVVCEETESLRKKEKNIKVITVYWL